MTESTDRGIKDQIAAMVCRLLEKHGLDRPIDANEDLADAGLSSSQMVELMLSVEEEFSITVPEREMRPANFRSISNIDALVRSLRQNS